MFKKFKDRKYLFIPGGKSNLTNYDKKLLLSMFFVHLAWTGFFVMYIGLYWNNRTDVYKEMTARCGLMNQILKADARLDSEIEMIKAKRRMQSESIGVKIEPTKRGRPLLDLLKEYKRKYQN